MVGLIGCTKQGMQRTVENCGWLVARGSRVEKCTVVPSLFFASPFSLFERTCPAAATIDPRIPLEKTIGYLLSAIVYFQGTSSTTACVEYALLNEFQPLGSNPASSQSALQPAISHPQILECHFFAIGAVPEGTRCIPSTLPKLLQSIRIGQRLINKENFSGNETFSSLLVGFTADITPSDFTLS